LADALSTNADRAKSPALWRGNRSTIKETLCLPRRSPQQPSPQRLGQIAWAFAAPLIVEAAVKNRVFDVLDRGPRSLEDLARDVGASPRGLRAIANALVALELLVAR
jgi:hypothetical protein